MTTVIWGGNEKAIAYTGKIRSLPDSVKDSIRLIYNIYRCLEEILMKVANSIADLIGNTPLVKLNRVVNSDHADRSESVV